MATDDLEGFKRRITVIAAQVENGVELTMRKVALAVDQAIVMETPVDTGRARMNWIVTVTSPTGDVRPTPSSPSEGAQDALSKGAGTVGGYTLSQGTIFIQNNLPYIKRLDEGWSKQKPNGFVRKAVMAGVGAVQGARVLGG